MGTLAAIGFMVVVGFMVLLYIVSQYFKIENEKEYKEFIKRLDLEKEQMVNKTKVKDE